MRKSEGEVIECRKCGGEGINGHIFLAVFALQVRKKMKAKSGWQISCFLC